MLPGPNPAVSAEPPLAPVACSPLPCVNRAQLPCSAPDLAEFSHPVTRFLPHQPLASLSPEGAIFLEFFFFFSFLSSCGVVHISSVWRIGQSSCWVPRHLHCRLSSYLSSEPLVQIWLFPTKVFSQKGCEPGREGILPLTPVTHRSLGFLSCCSLCLALKAAWLFGQDDLPQ